MKKLIKPGKRTVFSTAVCVVLMMLIIISSCRKSNVSKNDLRNFEQVNLVANNGTYHPVLTDPTLMNAWGLAWSPNGIAWVNSQAGHVSELYTAEGAIVRPPVNIPSPGDTIGGLPTGIVFAGGSGFKLSNGQGAAFLFDGVDGVVSGWNQPAGNNAIRIADLSSTSAYTGLALSVWHGAHLLYGANFRTGKIDVWDTLFNPVNLPFTDPNLPQGFSPFNIQAVGDWLYVLYAKVGSDGEDEPGPGLGFVDIYQPDGTLVKRFASGGWLNAPWGVTMAPAGFLQSSDMSGGNGDSNKPGGMYGSSMQKPDQPVILIGNFGDGKINVYSTEGEWLGQLQSRHSPIVIEGLWALSFAPATAMSIDPNRLYFTAGPNDEKDGIFGYLIKK